MGRLKDQLGEAPATIGRARSLGARGLIVICPPPCRHRASIPIPAGLAGETAIVSLSTRLCCDACDRRVATVSIDWGFTSARPIDPRS